MTYRAPISLKESGRVLSDRQNAIRESVSLSVGGKLFSVNWPWSLLTRFPYVFSKCSRKCRSI